MKVKEASGIVALASSKFTWNIANLSKFSVTKLHSDIFIAGDCKWRLLLFPRGVEVISLSIYLDVADSTDLPDGWYRDAKFSLAVINQFRKSATVTKEARHVFSVKNKDWGFHSVIPASKLNPAEGYRVKDSLTVECVVDVLSAGHYSKVDNEKQLNKSGPKKALEPAVEAPPNQTPLMVQKQKAISDVEARIAAPAVTCTSVIHEPLKHSKGDKEGNMPATEGTQIHSEGEAQVQTVSKRLLTELSIMRKKQKLIFGKEILGSSQAAEYTSDVQQQQKEALRGFFNMSLESIQQANCFVKIEEILHALVEHANNVDEKTVLEDTMSRLADFKRSIHSAKEIAESAQAHRTSVAGKTADVDSKLEQRHKELRLLESEFLTLSEEEAKLQGAIDRVIAQKKSVSVKLERANKETCKEIETWRSLEAEMKLVNAKLFGAKEKLASANVCWDRFREDLGLGELC